MRFENLFSEEQRIWIQCAMDVIGYSENVPIRLLDTNELNALDPKLLFSLGEELQFPTNRSFDALLEEFCNGVQQAFEAPEKADEIENSIPIPNALPGLSDEDSSCHEHLRSIDQRIWKNWPSNHLQLQNLFRLSEEWVWFVNVWCYVNRHKISHGDPNGINELNAFGISGWKIYSFKMPNMEDRDITVVCGPVYSENEKEPSGSLNQDKDNNILNAFRLYQQFFAKDGISNRFADLDLSRTLNSRSTLSAGVAMKRVENTREHIRDINEVFQAWPGSLEKSHGLLSNIITSVVATRRLTKHFEATATYTFCHYDLDRRESAEEGVWAEISRATSGRLEAIRLTAISSALHSDHVLQDVRSSTIEIDIDECRSRVEAWSERIVERRRAIQSSRVTSFHDWINFHASSFRGANESVSQRLFNFICQMMLEGVRADICHMYEYRPWDDGVRVLGRAYSNEKSAALVDISNSVVRDMEEISESSKHRSIVYRCIHSGEEQFSPDSKSHYASNQKVRDAIKCILVVPIKIHGRLLGVVELKTLVAYGLQRSNRFTINHFAGIFSPFWYHQKLISSFQKLNQLIMQPALDPAYRVHEIGMHEFDEHAKILADIFRARGAAIWMRDETEPGNYLISGYSGLEIFDVDDGRRVSVNYKSEADSLSVCGEMLRRYLGKSDLTSSGKGALTYVKAVLSPNLKKSVYADALWYLGQDYLDQQPLKSDVFNTFSSFRAILVCSEESSAVLSENVLEEPIAIITLYDKEDIAEPTWVELVKYVREELYFALEVFYSQHEKYSQLNRIVRHELRSKNLEIGGLLGQALASVQSLQRSTRLLEPTLHDESQLEIFKDQLQWISSLLFTLKAAKKRRAEELSYIETVGKDEIHSVAKALGAEEDGLEHEWIKIGVELESLKKARLTNLKKSGLYLDIKVDSKCELYFDYNFFAHFWGNLFDNVLKHALPVESIKIELIEPQPETSPSSWIFRLTNVGKRLPDNMSIFQLFNIGTRANAKSSQDGDGIGLFLVKQICGAYGIDYSRSRVEETDNPQFQRFMFIFFVPEYLVRRQGGQNRDL